MDSDDSCEDMPKKRAKTRFTLQEYESLRTRQLFSTSQMIRGATLNMERIVKLMPSWMSLENQEHLQL
ncbi:hypothetical protein J6590_027346 [Homalodisca vitripennis]|nr:hypothetical protein J6590_027346 [Homalodisca vitripennis]